MNLWNHRQRGRASLTLALLGFALSAVAVEPTISVSARQRYPWNGLVDINFIITGDAGTKYDTSFTAKDMVGNTNIAMRTIRKADGTAASATEQLLPGNYKWVWDAAADLPDGFTCDRVTVTGKLDDTTPLYMVVDLSSGADSSSYPVSFLNAVPSGGWSDEYKTLKLVLRRIDPGSFMMGGEYNVTLTKPYYIGVFEVTQKQYKLVMGTNPSVYDGDDRPVESVAWGTIRGSDENGSLISPLSPIDSESFLGKLHSRTSLMFDLPTEAQWEYACRAGTTSNFNNGGDSEDDLRNLGRYSDNRGDGRGGVTFHTKVGLYTPNSWGLYDMHGNVSELCRDAAGDLADNLTDPINSASWALRILRGGGWHDNYLVCGSSWRNHTGGWTTEYSIGFRVVGASENP